MGFIVVSSNWSGRLDLTFRSRPFDEAARRKVQWRSLALSRELPMMVSRLPPLTRTVFAAVLLSFGMALTGLGAACDSEPPPIPPISVSTP